jgi:hypothetical protein
MTNVKPFSISKQKDEGDMNNITAPGQHNKSFFSKYQKNRKSQQGCLPAKEQACRKQSLSTVTKPNWLPTCFLI